MQPNLPEGGKTLVYFTIDNHNVHLDYYLPPVTSGNLPAIIYYHGGGMTAGSRRGRGFPHWLYNHCQQNNYIFIAADYRLCHPTTALDQIEDAKAMFTFLSGPFQSVLPDTTTIDTTRIAVTGFSAGGFSARAACVYANPKPAALLTGYGSCGDWLLDHWTRARPPTSIAKMVDLDAVPQLLADKTVVSDDMPQGGGMMSNRFALTVRWELDGTFLDGCLGRDGLGAELNTVRYEERVGRIPEDLKPAFLQLFVDEKYPPSVFVHGTADEVVPDQESITHYERLRALGVKTELLLVEGGGHGLMDFGAGFPPKPAKGSVEAYARGLEFIDEVFGRV
ncbi:alpha/beta-hydrolase [Aspergillus sclerotiicarbonarius CBS 121057]|uniref:Alpha/beta-hydrolase n=1 Tax=Aspergillus sclerotiicarbonarius (strain CBS 121057 / IBT 28362) TaxID=1448318 RepID=A0A319F7T6_ASPSB|nr:alpha/beta-hydrolase [Aspergillus sclerotiicarbonarius CBS 121057]